MPSRKEKRKIVYVCNSSVLISLSRIKRLSLIKKLFCEITIPKAVWQECVIQGESYKESQDIKKAKWINVKDVVKNKDLVEILETQLDKGESETIALGMELNADRLLLDEKEAREIAKKLKLKMTGTIGILLKAKEKGLISNLTKEIDKLKNIANFRISDEIVSSILSIAGEADSLSH